MVLGCFSASPITSNTAIIIARGTVAINVLSSKMIIKNIIIILLKFSIFDKIIMNYISSISSAIYFNLNLGKLGYFAGKGSSWNLNG